MGTHVAIGVLIRNRLEEQKLKSSEVRVLRYKGLDARRQLSDARVKDGGPSTLYYKFLIFILGPSFQKPLCFRFVWLSGIQEARIPWIPDSHSKFRYRGFWNDVLG